MTIKYLGHSALQLTIGTKNILVDPFISQNPKASEIDVKSLQADYIMLTHAHYDHIGDVEEIAARTGATLIANHEIVTYYEQKNIKGHPMNPGGTWAFDFGKVKVVTAVHSSSFPDGANGGNPVGFILDTGEKVIYLAGDTALTMDMKLIPLFYQLDLAVLPVGSNFTMDVAEAVVASDFVACNRVLGIHYDTAPFIEIDHEQSRRAFADKGKELILLPVGGTLEV